MKYYSAYGIIFQSGIELPELAPINPKNLIADVHISLGKVPEKILNPEIEAVWYQMNAKQLLLKIESLGKYLVEDGNKIVIEPEPGIQESAIRIWLLGPCFAILLHQRNIFPLHSSGIHTPFGAVLFTGTTGLGKSTLLNTFLCRNYKMISDDIVGISLFDDRVPIALPGFPRTKIWADSAQYFDIDLTDLPRIHPDFDKYSLKLGDAFINESQNIHRIYILEQRDAHQLSLDYLSNFDKFQYLLLNTFGLSFIRKVSSRDKNFLLVSTIAKHLPIFLVNRPAKCHPEEVADLMEMDFSG